MKIEKLVILKITNNFKNKAKKAQGGQKQSLQAITCYLQNKIPSFSK